MSVEIVSAMSTGNSIRADDRFDYAKS
jgi:hypothetical protein